MSFALAILTALVAPSADYAEVCASHYIVMAQTKAYPGLKKDASDARVAAAVQSSIRWGKRAQYALIKSDVIAEGQEPPQRVLEKAKQIYGTIFEGTFDSQRHMEIIWRCDDLYGIAHIKP